MVMIPIQTVDITSSGTQVVFTNIPQTYKALHIRGFIRAVAATESTAIVYELNGNNSTASYNFHTFFADGSTVISQAFNGYNSGELQRGPAGNITNSNLYGGFYADILDYSNTSKNTTVVAIGGYDNNSITNGKIYLNTSSWLNTSAVTELKLYGYGDWEAGSTMTLYGVV